MVAVVVHHRDAGDLPLHLETAPHTGVLGKARPHLVERDPSFQSDRRRRKGVAHVVAPGGPEEDSPSRSPLAKTANRFVIPDATTSSAR